MFITLKPPEERAGLSTAQVIDRLRRNLYRVAGIRLFMSDDECLFRLAQAIDAPDGEHLDEVARLIARLAVSIE